MRRMTQRLFAAVAAVLGISGLASAQYQPTPYPNIPAPVFPASAYQPVIPVAVPQVMPSQYLASTPIQPVQTQPIYVQQPAQTQPVYVQQQAAPIAAPAPAPVGPVVGAAPAVGAPGCSSCGNGKISYGVPSPYLPQRTSWGPGLAPVPYNETCADCANGCGSVKSDLGFWFNSCKSFFNPCGPIPCGGLCNGRTKCPAYPYGHPYSTGFNTCKYDSNLNH